MDEPAVEDDLYFEKVLVFRIHILQYGKIMREHCFKIINFSQDPSGKICKVFCTFPHGFNDILLTHGSISAHKLLYQKNLCALCGGNIFVPTNGQIFQLKCRQSLSCLGFSLKLVKFTIFKCFELKRMCFDLN